MNRPEIISNFLKDKKALIIDATSGRASLRKVLSELGMRTTSISVADNFAEAEKKIQSIAVELVFADYVIDGRSGLDLMKVHKKLFPLRLGAAFFVLSDQNSDSVASYVADENADELIIRPFTYADLTQRISEVLFKKGSANESDNILDNAHAKIEAGNVEEALALIAKVRADSPDRDNLEFYEGLAHQKAGHHEKARDALRAAVIQNPNHYRSLSALFDSLLQSGDVTEAYEIGSTLFKGFPVNPKRIPELVRLSIVNRKFDDIDLYHEIFQKFHTADLSAGIHIAAGLVICGKYFLRKGETAKAVETFRKAQSSANGKLSILVEILNTLLDAGLYKDAEAFFLKIQSDLRKKPEFAICDFEIMNQHANPPEILKRGLQLLLQGARSPRVFEILIKRSVELERKPEAIEELVMEGINHFPENEPMFRAAQVAKQPSQKP